MSAFSLPCSPANLAVHLHCSWDAPLPPDVNVGIPSSVDNLAPFIFGAYLPLRPKAEYSGELLRTL